MSKTPKKMVMLPFEALNNLAAIQLQKPENRDPNLQAMHSLDTEMTDLLYNGSNSQLSPANQLALFQQLKRRRNNIDRRHVTPNLSTVHTSPATVYKKSAQSIMSYISKNKRLKAKVLLDHLEANPLVDWDEKLEISVNGKPLPGSNLVDIVTDLCRDRGTSTTEPIGIKEFASALTTHNVPKSAILNPNRRYLFDAPETPSPIKNRAPSATVNSSPRSTRKSERKKVKKIAWDSYDQ